MEATMKRMSGTEFESYLARKYGANSHGLKVLREVEATMKARLKLRRVVAGTMEVKEAPAPAATPVPTVIDLSGVDLDAYGRRWQTGDGIAVLAREIGGVSWNYLHTVLTKRGYQKAS